jgi:hypothetical protein
VCTKKTTDRIAHSTSGRSLTHMYVCCKSHKCFYVTRKNGGTSLTHTEAFWLTSKMIIMTFTLFHSVNPYYRLTLKIYLNPLKICHPQLECFTVSTMRTTWYSWDLHFWDKCKYKNSQVSSWMGKNTPFLLYSQNFLDQLLCLVWSIRTVLHETTQNNYSSCVTAFLLLPAMAQFGGGG